MIGIASGTKAMELGCGPLEWLFLFLFYFIMNGVIITHSMPQARLRKSYGS